MNKLQEKKEELTKALLQVGQEQEDTNEQLELLLKQFAERQDLLGNKLVELTEQENKISNQLEVINELLNDKKA